MPDDCPECQEQKAEAPAVPASPELQGWGAPDANGVAAAAAPSAVVPPAAAAGDVVASGGGATFVAASGMDQAMEAVEALQEEEPEARFQVVIVTSELAPYSKSGGLADVCSKLSIALSQMGHRVMTVAPAYKQYDGAQGTDIRKTFNLYGFGTEVHYLHKWRNTSQDDPEMGVDEVFVQNQCCFERAGMYGDPGSHDYFDNLYRFAILCWAALEAPLVLPAATPFGERVVFIANDWQTGLLPLILTSHYRRWRCYGPARCLFVVHNMGYHGNFPNPLMYNYDLPDPRDTPKWDLQDIGLKVRVTAHACRSQLPAAPCCLPCPLGPALDAHFFAAETCIQPTCALPKLREHIETRGRADMRACSLASPLARTRSLVVVDTVVFAQRPPVLRSISASRMRVPSPAVHTVTACVCWVSRDYRRTMRTTTATSTFSRSVCVQVLMRVDNSVFVWACVLVTLSKHVRGF